MPPSTNGWIRYVMLGLCAVMVVALLCTAYVLWTTPKTIRDALRVPTAGAESAGPPSESTVEAIPLNGGVSIAYQAPDGPALALFPVHYAAAYTEYAEFKHGWPSNDTATVQFALIETEQGSGEWHLFHTGLITTTGITPTEWAEYALLLEPETNVVKFVTDPAQTIVKSTLFAVEAGADTRSSLSSLVSSGADLSLTSRLLLVDHSSGETKYTIVIIDPVSGDGLTRWCSRCRSSTPCSWICSRIHWW